MTVPGYLYYYPNLFPPYDLDYAYLAGTSMATPLVSGTAGLYYGKNNLRRGNWTNVRASRAIQAGCFNALGVTNGGWNSTQGYGALNADATIQDAMGRSATVGSIEGIVYINSIATANVPVRAKKGTVTFTASTRPDGTYKFDALTPGTYQVYIPGAGAGLPITSKNVIVKVGSDYPNCNFWATGTFNFDDTPPVIGTFSVKGQTNGLVLGNHWAYDTETGLNKMTMSIGTSVGGTNILPETEVFVGGDTTTLDPSSFRFSGLTIQKARRYYLRATYMNGAGLSTVRDVSFYGGGLHTGGPH